MGSELEKVLKVRVLSFFKTTICDRSGEEYSICQSKALSPICLSLGGTGQYAILS